MPIRTGQVLRKRYKILKELCEGGYGTIFLAVDNSLDISCALKENTDPSPRSQKQFRKEARILARLEHPNLVRVIDYFIEPDGSQYLVMNYIKGTDLHDMLDERDNPLAQDDVLDWSLQICDALIYLHNQSPPVIHRDIKPANIIITPDGKAVLVDFGIAKVFESGRVTTKGAMGVSTGYSSPEQYGGSGTDACSDVYSLGATLYTLLTNQVPPESVDIMAGRTPASKPVQQISPSVSDHVSDAVEKAMQIDRNQRFPNVSAFRDALIGNSEAKSVRSGNVAGKATAAAALSSSANSQHSKYPQVRLRGNRFKRVLLSIFLLIFLTFLISTFLFQPIPLSEFNLAIPNFHNPEIENDSSQIPILITPTQTETSKPESIPTKMTCIVTTGYDNGRANIREKPDQNSSAPHFVNEGDILIVLSEGQTDWIKVRIPSGKEGWIYNKLCK